MKELFCNKAYNRLQAHYFMTQLHYTFDKNFSDLSYQLVQPRRVIDTKRVDPTTRFVGSHTTSYGDVQQAFQIIHYVSGL